MINMIICCCSRQIKAIVGELLLYDDDQDDNMLSRSPDKSYLAAAVLSSDYHHNDHSHVEWYNDDQDDNCYWSRQIKAISLSCSYPQIIVIRIIMITVMMCRMSRMIKMMLLSDVPDAGIKLSEGSIGPGLMRGMKSDRAVEPLFCPTLFYPIPTFIWLSTLSS